MGGDDSVMQRSLRMKASHVSSAVVLAIARYSASVLDREIVCYFFAHYEIRFPPRNVQ